MIVVASREPRVLPRILQALSDEGVRAHGGAVRDAADGEDLFTLAAESNATAIVGVEPLGWWGAPASGAPDDALLERCLAAAQAPSRPRLVWVTAQGADAPGERRIRKSGVPYVVVRVSPLLPLASALVAASIEGQEVLVPEELPDPTLGVTTPEELGAAVADAVCSESVGRAVAVGHRGPDAWTGVVAALGGRGRKVGAFRASAGRLLGQRVLALADDALTLRGLRARPEHTPDRRAGAGAPQATT